MGERSWTAGRANPHPNPLPRLREGVRHRLGPTRLATVNNVFEKYTQDGGENVPPITTP